jgi:hypothetical protein
VAGGAAWLSQQASRNATAVSRDLAGIEKDRRAAERVPRLTARLEKRGVSQRGFMLAVWLESPEPLASIRVFVQEARDKDCPVGFQASQEGVVQHPDENPGYFGASSRLAVGRHAACRGLGQADVPRHGSGLDDGLAQHS